MYEGMTKRSGSVFLMASKCLFLPRSVIQKRKLLQQCLICSVLIVSAMIRHPLNFERLGNAGLESYVSSGRTVNSKSAEKCIFSESNESQAMADREMVSCSWSSQIWLPVEMGSQIICKSGVNARGTIPIGALN